MTSEAITVQVIQLLSGSHKMLVLGTQQPYHEETNLEKNQSSQPSALTDYSIDSPAPNLLGV